MDTFEMFFNKQYWQDAIEHGVEKYLNLGMLTQMGTAEGKINLMSDMLQDKIIADIPEVKYIPKDDGNMRRVLVSGDRDRIMFYIANLVYCDKYKEELSSKCYSYTRGVSSYVAVKNIQREMRKFEGIKLDVHKFFDSVPIDVINRVFDREEPNPLNTYLRKFYNTNLVRENGVEKEEYKSLCQGCAFSSFLSRWVLAKMDKGMSKFDVEYARYSDDLIIVGKEWKEAYQFVIKCFDELGLKINDKKTEYISETGYVDFLGYRIWKDKIGMSDKHINSFKAMIKKLTKPKQKNALKKIYKYLYGGEYPWAEKHFKAITDAEEFRKLDAYIIERVQYSLSGKYSASRNKRYKFEYYSLYQAYKNYKNDNDVYRAEVLSLMCNRKAKVNHSEESLAECLEKFKNSVNDKYSVYALVAKSNDELSEYYLINNFKREEYYNKVVTKLVELDLDFGENFYIKLGGQIILRSMYERWRKELEETPISEK